MAPALEEPRISAQDSIYDLPSSDEDGQRSTVGRKGRRQGSSGNASLHQDCHASRPAAIVDNSGRPRSHSTPKQDGGGFITENGSPGTRRATRDRSWLLGRKEEGCLQLTRQTVPAAPATERMIESTKAEVPFSDNNEALRRARMENNSTNKRPNARNPVSPSPRKVARTTAGSMTPGRRRLIDSLATREQSEDEGSPKKPIDSPLCSPFSRRSPNPPNPLKENIESRTIPNGENLDGYGQDATVLASPHLRGSKVTYARQRSFLDDLLGQALPTDLEQFDPLISPRGSNENMPRAHIFAIDEVNNDDDGTVRSIHELRQAGGNVRYRGAVEAIFEDIEDPHNSVSARSSALSQLCGKLLDSRLARQFVDCGFDKRLVDCLSPDLDVIPATLALCAFGLASQGRPLPYVLATAAWPKLLGTSPILLSVQDDLSIMARAQTNNLSRPVQKLVQNTASQIKSALFQDDSSIRVSPCFLVLHCFNVTISAFQNKGECPSRLPTTLLKQLVDLLLSKSPRGDGSCASLPKESQVLELGLSILEVHTTSGGPAREEHRKILSLLNDMHGLLCAKDNSDTASQQMQMLYIRVILNMTNNDPMLCDSFATYAMVGQLAEVAITNFGDLTEDSLAQENNTLDTVILALGALINLTEQSEASRAIFVHATRGGQSLLGRLSRLFMDNVDSTSKVTLILFLSPLC